MTTPLQQAIERSRTASDWCTTEERVFREAAAIMAEALDNDPNNLKIIAKKALSNVTPPEAEGGQGA